MLKRSLRREIKNFFVIPRPKNIISSVLSVLLMPKKIHVVFLAMRFNIEMILKMNGPRLVNGGNFSEKKI